MIEYVAKNTPATRDEVAGHIGMVPQSVSKKAQLLKGLGILRSDKDGYHFTAKGVRFLRRWLPERRQVTDVTDATGLGRTKDLPQESGEVKTLGSPPGGLIGRIGRLDKPTPDGRQTPSGKMPETPRAVKPQADFEDAAHVRGNLREKLNIVLHVIKETQEPTGTSDKTLKKLLEEVYSINEKEADKLIGILTRDKAIYSPRPGRYRATT